jgi:predicted PurR-regulated permease PerM
VNDDPLKTGTTDDTVAESSLSQLPEPVKRVVRSIGQVLQTTFGLAVNSLLIFFVGLFLAISPDAYRDGLIRLIPPVRRQRAGEVLEAMSRGVWRWLIGRFGSMLVTGIGAFLLLWLIGVPMAGTLGVITGLLTFVPNIGAAVALMLAILFALPQGLAAAGTVLAAYLALQMCESYIVTPLIQQEQVSLPPALLIAFQALMWVLCGFLGAAVASPLLVAVKTSIQMLYIEDYLGDV